jgi:hypothetical protein
MVIKRIKEGFKKIVKSRRKSTEKVTGVTRGLLRRKGDRVALQKAKEPVHADKEVIGRQETAVETAKYFMPQQARDPRVMPQELPGGYGEDKIVLQVRDPWWLHSYWEIRGDTIDRIRQEVGDAFYGAQRTLRVYDVSYIVFDGSNANRFFDLAINHDANSWYIDTGGPGRSWCVDYGLKFPDGRFITIVRSNVVMTPLEGPSGITDEEWMVPEDVFARLYGMGFGFGKSSPVGKAWQERVRRALFSGVLASPGMASMASPVKRIPKERKFWLVVNTELIVYGATEPDAKVTVQGKEIKLRPDGTFSLRFALPDGKQVIPVEATSSDQEEVRTITPIVTKETR